MSFRVMIDGKKKTTANDAKVIWEDVEATIEDQEVKGQLHLTATSEGVILDFFDGDCNEVLITQSITHEDLINLMLTS
jgi:hypothetical protein